MNSIIEARRHLNNAKEILREKAGKEDGYYLNKKYVKMAGLAAYKSVLLPWTIYLAIRKNLPEKVQNGIRSNSLILIEKSQTHLKSIRFFTYQWDMEEPEIIKLQPSA